MEDLVAIFITVLRLVVPLSLFRWPLLGAVLCTAADASDVMLMEKFGWGYFGNNMYHTFDKIFDIYYLFFEFLIVFKWKDMLARRTAKALFIWRFVGFAVYEIFGIRAVFFLAPNIFEHFYIAWVVIQKWFKNFVLTPTKLVMILLVVGLPKIAQEYVMHFKYPDQTWNFLRDNLFWWLYK